MLKYFRSEICEYTSIWRLDENTFSLAWQNWFIKLCFLQAASLKQNWQFSLNFLLEK